ncbi:adhesin transport system outer membrane protein [Ochrobactrum intermedium]|uniref:Adhesin transport system outer membrane protein n=1 Tax=Brucella intermedia TaxID=94625 RepID=A0ABR6AV55_9HYPH|nr:TolC family protein [Brucella intermedia]MBA8853342.1 adhesin transport system outer membrane protein [Brucella intermedia]
MNKPIPAWRTVIGTALAGLLLSSCTTTDPAVSDMAPTLTPSSRNTEAAGQRTSATAAHTAAAKPLPLPAAGSRITLENAVHTALNWHPSIDEAVAKIGEADAEIEVARAGYFPKVQGGLNGNYRSADGGEWRPKLNVSASQMIYDFGKVSSAVEARTAGANVSRAQLLLGVDVLVRDTANAVIEVQRYRALLTVAKNQLSGVQAIASLVTQRSDKGASTRSDEIQAAARVQAAQSTVLEITGQLQRWENTLANLLGRSGAVNIDANVPKWLSSTCNASEPDWSQAPGLLQAEARKAEAVAQLKLSRARVMPTLALEAGSGYGFNQSSSREDYRDQPDFTIGLNLTGDLYDGGAKAAARNAATHALTAAEAAIRNSRFDINNSLTQARSQTGSLQQLLASLSARDGMMRQTRDLYRQQYIELGTRTLLDLLNAEQELHQAGFDTANTVHDLRKLGVECMFSSGRSRQFFALQGMTIKGITL